MVNRNYRDPDVYILRFLEFFQNKPTGEDLLKAKEILRAHAIPLSKALEAVACRAVSCEPSDILDSFWKIAGTSLRPRHFTQDVLSRLLSSRDAHPKFAAFEWTGSDRRDFLSRVRDFCDAPTEEGILDSLCEYFLDAFYQERALVKDFDRTVSVDARCALTYRCIDSFSCIMY